MNQSKKKMNKGIIVFLDLDNFQEVVKLKNWENYKPNPITSFLTHYLQDVIYKYHAVHLLGINEARGTEEAILLFYIKLTIIEDIFRELINKISILAKNYRIDTGLSIGIARGPISGLNEIKSHSLTEFKKHPTLFLAYKALKKAKSKGGNSIVII